MSLIMCLICVPRPTLKKVPIAFVEADRASAAHSLSVLDQLFSLSENTILLIDVSHPVVSLKL